MQYTPPTVSDLGSLEELTLDYTNKVGKGRDGATRLTGLVGTIITVVS